MPNSPRSEQVSTAKVMTGLACKTLLAISRTPASLLEPVCFST